MSTTAASPSLDAPRAPLPLTVAVPLALGSGAASVLGFAPFGLWLAPILALAIWYQTLLGRDRGGAFAVGWAFGLGLLGVGIYWIRISLNEFGNMSVPVANALMVLFVAAMALYYGIAGLLVHLISPPAGGRHAWAGPVLVLPAVWVLLEWLRGWLFTGFPWLVLGNSQIDSPLGGLAPVLGVLGLSFCVALTAGLVWLLVLRPRYGRVRLAAGLLMLWVVAYILGRQPWTQAVGPPLRAAVLQASIEQSLKWDPDGLLPTIQAHLEMTRDALGSDLIVWPETAIPEFLHGVEAALIEPLSSDARRAGSEVVIGIPIMESPERYYNGLLSIGSARDTYYKRHLVPFGEYLPFKAQLGPLIDWFEVPMSDFTPGAAERPLLQVGPHQVGVSICYEDIFPEEVRQALPEAAYLVNVSNDGWFGESWAAAQHLEFSRMRALENQRFLVRATNTGISAIIDHEGRVLDTVPLFKRATLTGELQPREGMTPFSRWGHWPVLGLSVLMLAIALLLRRQRPR
jgi:apolipoprotein N-acyltransferase